MDDEDLKPSSEITDELRYLRDIVDSYDKTDGKNLDFGMNKVDALNVLHNMIEHIPSFIYAKDKNMFVNMSQLIGRFTLLIGKVIPGEVPDTPPKIK